MHLKISSAKWRPFCLGHNVLNKFGGHGLDKSLQWRHNGRDGVSNHQRLGCLLNRLFRSRSAKTSKLRVTGCEGNSPVIGEFPAQRASNVDTGRIRLSVSTVNRTYELSGITHVTPFRKYEKHLTGPSTYGPWVRIPTASFSPVSPFLRFSVTESSRMKSVRTEGCHVGLFREFVVTASCTYTQSNTTNVSIWWRHHVKKLILVT